MKILLLGLTGGTGREIVREAGGQGHTVVALVRSRAKAAGFSGVELIEGDARDEQALSSALDGCSGVISSLGTKVSPFREVTLLSDATRALVLAMEKRSVRRLVCITGLGAGDSRGHGGFLFDNLFFPLLLRKVYDDKNRQEDVVRASPTCANSGGGSRQINALAEKSPLHFW
jgi:putative NADH-flavin reductase